MVTKAVPLVMITHIKWITMRTTTIYIRMQSKSIETVKPSNLIQCQQIHQPNDIKSDIHISITKSQPDLDEENMKAKQDNT